MYHQPETCNLKPYSTTFVFPIGKTLGGANIWSARMCGHLNQTNMPTVAVMHMNPGWHPDGELPIPAETRQLNCGEPAVTEASFNDVKKFTEVYGESLPAVFVPNWNNITYAVCAELTRARSDKVRVVGVAHGNNESYYGSLTYYEPIIHGFIAVSDEIAAELKRRLPHRVGDIYTRACPVDVPEHYDRTERRIGNPIVITYSGRITNHEKRVSDLTPLMQELDRQGVDFRFRVIGEGGYLPTLRYEIKQLPERIREWVTLEGIYTPDRMLEVWRETDVSVLVSDSEGTSISMLESMAAGCVPVVTRVSGTAAVIDDGVNGFTVPVGDLPALAGHIKQLAEDPALWSSVSRAAHQKVQMKYSYPDYVSWFTGLIEILRADEPRIWPKGRPLLPPSGRLRTWFRNLFHRG